MNSLSSGLSPLQLAYIFSHKDENEARPSSSYVNNFQLRQVCRTALISSLNCLLSVKPPLRHYLENIAIHQVIKYTVLTLGKVAFNKTTKMICWRTILHCNKLLSVQLSRCLLLLNSLFSSTAFISLDRLFMHRGQVLYEIFHIVTIQLCHIVNSCIHVYVARVIRNCFHAFCASQKLIIIEKYDDRNR